MKLTGKLEVFKNQNGYITAVIKDFDDNKQVRGKAYVSAKLPDYVVVEDNNSLTLDVKEGYLNAVYVDTDKPFTKLQINVVNCEVLNVFTPEKKSKKTSKKVK